MADAHQLLKLADENLKIIYVFQRLITFKNALYREATVNNVIQRYLTFYSTYIY